MGQDFTRHWLKSDTKKIDVCRVPRNDVVEVKKRKTANVIANHAISWRSVAFSRSRFRLSSPHISPIRHSYLSPCLNAGERLHPARKHILFLLVRTAAVANRCHVCRLVPDAIKRNRATKSLPAAQPLFQVDLHADRYH
jgi:hypothetical protein